MVYPRLADIKFFELNDNPYLQLDKKRIVRCMNSPFSCMDQGRKKLCTKNPDSKLTASILASIIISA